LIIHYLQAFEVLIVKKSKKCVGKAGKKLTSRSKYVPKFTAQQLHCLREKNSPMHTYSRSELANSCLKRKTQEQQQTMHRARHQVPPLFSNRQQ